MQSIHESVLLHEVIQGLTASNKTGAKGGADVPWYLDGTLGGAGHALAIAKALDGNVNIIGFDQDPQAIERDAKTLEGKAKKVILVRENFRNLDTVLDTHGIATVDYILLDLGLSSDELDASGRGFSFQRDEPLHMTFGDPSAHIFTAKTIVNEWTEEVIADIIFGYGEDRYARRIAKGIVIYRTKKPIETSMELAEIVKSSVPGFARKSKIHPATKTFQALRIAVNDELNSLKEGLEKGYARLGPGGRMAVISFHSLEDRIVKEFFKKQIKNGGRIFTKKPIQAGDQEVAENPRSRSAKLRIIEKI